MVSEKGDQQDLEVENGIPQGSAISPLLFNVMINDIFSKLNGSINSALYADDGIIWMRGRNVTHVIRNITSAIQEVERWSFEWGFKLSVNKSCYMIITNKRKVNNVNLTLYGQPLQKVSVFKYLGLWLDNKYTWKTHIQHLETKCKKVINLL